MHLSDLHLGKRVNGFSLISDQEYILDQILTLAKKERPDGVLLAGDIYDKPIPSAEAALLFDSFLTRLCKSGIPVFLISGNHDSAQRLAYGARLFKNMGIHIASAYEGRVSPVTLTDAWGEVKLYLLPFLRPATVRCAHPELADRILGYQDALQAAVDQMEVDVSGRNVLIAHQFVTGANRCESEEISVGGLDQVDAAVFRAFDYVALGHLHSPQQVGGKKIRYCGTPLKYSFSESGQEKSVTMVELGAKGEVEIRTLPLTPLRDMRCIRGTYLEVTARPFYEKANSRDYLQVTLTDEEDIPDGMQKLRIFYPNLMRLEYDNRRTRENRMVEAACRPEQKSELQLLEEFYERQNNSPMSREQNELAVGLLESIKSEMAEAGNHKGVPE